MLIFNYVHMYNSIALYTFVCVVTAQIAPDGVHVAQACHLRSWVQLVKHTKIKCITLNDLLSINII